MFYDTLNHFELDKPQKNLKAVGKLPKIGSVKQIGKLGDPALG
jgi:hypothetical protein